MPNVVFREFEEKDTKEVSAFIRKIFAEMGWTVEVSDLVDDPYTCFYKKNGFLIIGKDGTTLIATAGLIPLTSTSVVLKRFYVDEAYRGQGIAQELLQYVLERSREAGYKIVYLDVNVKNPRGIRFYEKAGFEKCSVQPNPLWSESIHPDGHLFYKKSL